MLLLCRKLLYSIVLRACRKRYLHVSCVVLLPALFYITVWSLLPCTLQTINSINQSINQLVVTCNAVRGQRRVSVRRPWQSIKIRWNTWVQLYSIVFYTHQAFSTVGKTPHVGRRRPPRTMTTSWLCCSWSTASVASCRCTAILYNCASSYRRGTRYSGPSRRSNTSLGTRISTFRLVYADAGLGRESSRCLCTANSGLSLLLGRYLKNMNDLLR